MRIRSFFVMLFGADAGAVAFVQAASSPIHKKVRMSLRIYRSYAESSVRRDRFPDPMRKAILVILAGAAVSLHAEQKFSAADIPGLHLRKPGAVVITNETIAHYAHARVSEAIEAAARVH